MMSRNGSLAKDLTIAADSDTDQPFNSIEYISEIYYETPPSKVHVIPPFPDPAAAQPAGIPVVKAEEALIVIFVLVLWVAAIALFFNRWGKIRMLEPYQPKFHQEHRQSCPMVEIGTSVGTHQHRMSFSKYNVNSCIDPPIFAAVPPTYRSSLIRPRQNSVFVGSSTNMLTSVSVNPPTRKTKSAIDIQSLILSEARDSQPLSSKSMLLPVTMSAAERRTSCSVLLSATAMVSTPKDRRASCSTTGMLLTPRPADRRPSSSVDHVVRDRQMSYCGDFLLSPQPPHRSDYRRTSSTGDYLSPIGIGASRESRRPSFNNVIAQVTAEQRRPSSSMLRISSNI